jgi:hypothetical protein
VLFDVIHTAEDPLYSSLRDNPRAADVRAYLEGLWLKFRPYADPHFLDEFARQFFPRFWEMYLGCSLLDTGFSLEPSGGAGPDFRARGPHGELVLIEAAAATAGVSDDAVPELENDKVVQVLTERIVLRITSAIRTKHEKLLGFVQSKSVPDGAHLVVAVNTGSIGHAVGLFNPPLSVQAVLPIGNLQVMFDREDPDYRQESYAHRSEIQRPSGHSPVSTSFFLDPESSILSGFLYSNASPFSLPRPSGGEFEFIHRPQISVALSRGWFPRGREFWIEAGQLKSRDWGTDQSR